LHRRVLNIALSVAAAVGLAACAETGAPYYRPIADYPAADPALGEKLATGEEESAARIAAIIEAHLRHMYAAGTIYRDAHPKADGCVKATFTVEAGLAAPLRQGLFSAAKSYDAMIRFSNANEDRKRSDDEGDGRGMAIKVYGPSETPLTQDPQGPASQDFIMINHPTFLVADPTSYRRLIGYVDSSDKLTSAFTPVLSFLSLGWTGAKTAVDTTASHIDSPLNTRYWSMVPYQLGPKGAAVAVKYSAAPCAARPVVRPKTADPNYLRHAMAAELAPGGTGACMKLMVQPRTSDAMSVEDSRIEWPEAAAPFYKVATITIPPQAFDTPPQNIACEELSYSPWHALPGHKPLGAVNRMRKVIYERISAVRRSSPPPGTPG
jgi:catalase